MALSIVCMPLTITITLSGEIVLMCGIISRPLFPAMVMSEITSAYEVTRSRDRASSADDASAQSYDCSRRSCRTPRTAASSSTIRRRGLADSGIDSILQTSATIEPKLVAATSWCGIPFRITEGASFGLAHALYNMVLPLANTFLQHLQARVLARLSVNIAGLASGNMVAKLTFKSC